MRRWDRLLDAYVEEYRARGVSRESVTYTQARLDRWGRWLKRRRPRIAIEEIDVELITGYVVNCSSFRAKATVSATLSTMRRFGDYLVHQGLWKINPLRWMKGPKITPYSRLPKRIDHAHLEAMWREAANCHGEYSSHLWVTVLALLYGTGLRRGELERLNLDAFDRTEGTLRINGRKTGYERCVPLPEMVLRCLEAYLPLRHNQLKEKGCCGECALLVSRTGKRLTGGGISNGIHAIARRAHVPISSRRGLKNRRRGPCPPRSGSHRRTRTLRVLFRGWPRHSSRACAVRRRRISPRPRDDERAYLRSEIVP